jgi:hypothetical protein
MNLNGSLNNYLTGKLKVNAVMFQLLTLVQTTANNAKEVAANYIKTLDVNNIVQQIKEKVVFLR